MTKSKILISACLLALGLVGCAAQQPAEPSISGEEQGVEGAQPSAAAPEGAAEAAPADAQSLQRLVYFAFDSSAVDAESRSVIEANAAYLAANPQARVTLEGHTDERGTREYNLALGERRAQSVERVLRSGGIASNRISTVSFGEEKPVAPGQGEQAWGQNRRVEFVYR
jgi:peptidoglycan-associated lipoprotein